jgi:Competence protein J (ComJ)
MGEITVNFWLSYSQLAVFLSSLEQPFNDWSDSHAKQGFAWRPGSVSFRSLVDCGQHSVEIRVLEHSQAVHLESVRAIEVPFDVPDDGSIEVGSITQTIPINLPCGSYLLRCEFLSPPNENSERVRLTFASKDTPRFAVVLADSELSLDGRLLTFANAAVS